MLEEEVDCVVVASLGGPLEGCRDGLAALPIDLGAVLDEEPARGVLVVNCRPL